MIDCGFYAVGGLNMLLGRICDGCHSQGYDAPGLFDLLVIFVNVCVQGHDAPLERDVSIALLLQSGCVNESFNKWLKGNFKPLILVQKRWRYTLYSGQEMTSASTRSPAEYLKNRALSYFKIFQFLLIVLRCNSGTVSLKALRLERALPKYEATI